MSVKPRSVSMPALRWTVGLVVLLESLRFAFSSTDSQHLSRTGLPLWVGPVLGSVEALAALMFLIPKVDRTGGLLLLLVFAMAAAVHVLHGQFQIESLLVYAAAVFACMSKNGRLAPGDTK